MALNNMFDSKEIKKPNKSQKNHSIKNTKEASNDTQVNIKSEQQKEKQSMPGRPRTKTEAEKIINISVPMSTYKKMNIAKLQYNNNLTLYINKLIERDLNENLDKYKKNLLDI